MSEVIPRDVMDSHLRSRAAGAVAIYASREIRAGHLTEQAALEIFHSIFLDLFLGSQHEIGKRGKEDTQ